jgi:hypothetical protein
VPTDTRLGRSGAGRGVLYPTLVVTVAIMSTGAGEHTPTWHSVSAACC